MAGPRLSDEEVRAIRAQFDREFRKAYNEAPPLAKNGSATEYATAAAALRNDATLKTTLSLIDRQEAAELSSFRSARDAARLAAIQWLKNKWYRQAAAGVTVGLAGAAAAATGGKILQAGNQFRFAAQVASKSMARAAGTAKVGAAAAGSASLDAAAATAAGSAVNDLTASIEQNIKRYFQTQRWNATIQRHRAVKAGR